MLVLIKMSQPGLCINTFTAFRSYGGQTLTVELVDLRQVGEDAGQLVRVQDSPHLLIENLVQDP